MMPRIMNDDFFVLLPIMEFLIFLWEKRQEEERENQSVVTCLKSPQCFTVQTAALTAVMQCSNVHVGWLSREPAIHSRHRYMHRDVGLDPTWGSSLFLWKEEKVGCLRWWCCVALLCLLCLNYLIMFIHIIHVYMYFFLEILM